MASFIEVPALPARFTVIDDRPTDEAATTGHLAPRVLLVTEGTYPHAWGGVSTWCDSLVTVLPDVRFSILAIVAAPDIPPVFALPDNVDSVVTVPLWGVQDVKESWRSLTLPELWGSRAAVDAGEVAREFLPPFRSFLTTVLGEATESDPVVLADAIHALYQYLQTHDLRTTLAVPAVWETWSEVAQRVYGDASARLRLPELALWELTTGMQWVTRWLFPLAAPIPEVDVVHAAMAGICTMVSVAAKREYGAGFLLTEHGVYLRERYIAEAGRDDSYFLKLIGLRFARRMTELTYATADQVSPCCDYNGRWERRVGARPDQLQTIYYGVDHEAFSADKPISATPHRVVWVGRINPLKDVETLLRAAAETLKARPDVQFLLYGTAPEADKDYHQRCLALHEQLGLGESVTFCGYTSDPAEAFQSGDLVVLSSISEGFPYSTLEAMLCGRPVVATSVGGLPEQIAGAGAIVEPRNPTAMAAAIVDILGDAERCAQLGAAARAKAMAEFGHDKFGGQHRSSYLSLSARHNRWQTMLAAASPHEIVVPTQPHEVGPRDSRAEDDLLRRVQDASPVPVDGLEVAAVIESLGVTDQLAARTYGAPDVFALADRFYDQITSARSLQGVARRGGGGGPAVVERNGGFFDAARHPTWAVAPSVVLLLAMWALSKAEHWSDGRALTLALGMSAGMLSTNGLALALGRRASVALSLGKVGSARRFFLATLGLGVVLSAALAGVVSTVHWTAISFLPANREFFVLASVSVALLWLLAAALSLVAAFGWASAALALGLGATVGADVGLRQVMAAHFVVSGLLGLAVAFGTMLAVLHRSSARMARKQPGLEKLPTVGYLVAEGWPYFVYGTLAVALFVSVHVVGWAVLGGDRAAVATLELGLFLPLAPTVLAAGRAERDLRLFWVAADELQHATTAADRATFGRALHDRYRSLVRGYLVHLAVSSAATVAVVETLLRTHVVSHVVHYGSVTTVRELYLSGIVAYGLLGLGQFNAMFALSFLRHGRPLRALLLALAVAVAAAVVVAQLAGTAWLAAALAAGTLVYAIDAYTSVRPLLAGADQAYLGAV